MVVGETMHETRHGEGGQWNSGKEANTCKAIRHCIQTAPAVHSFVSTKHCPESERQPDSRIEAEEE